MQSFPHATYHFSRGFPKPMSQSGSILLASSNLWTSDILCAPVCSRADDVHVHVVAGIAGPGACVQRCLCHTHGCGWCTVWEWRERAASAAVDSGECGAHPRGWSILVAADRGAAAPAVRVYHACTLVIIHLSVSSTLPASVGCSHWRNVRLQYSLSGR